MLKKIISLIIIASSFAACSKRSGTEEKSISGIPDHGVSPDSLITGTWLTTNPIDSSQSQGMTLHADGSAASVGMATLLYQRWKMTGDTLILTYESIGNRVSSIGNDSLHIVKLDADSLVLSNWVEVVRFGR